MAQIPYVDWEGLVYYDDKIKKYIAERLESCIKDGGNISFNQLPQPSANNFNYIYIITDAFIPNEFFVYTENETYPANTMIRVIEYQPGTYRYKVIDNGGYPDIPDTPSSPEDLDARIDRLSEEVISLGVTLAETNQDLLNEHERIDALEEAIENISSGSISVDLSNYYTKEEVNEAIADAVNEIEHPVVDLNGYATEAWVKEQSYLTAEDVNDFASKDDIPTKVSELANDKGFITLSDIDLNSKADNILFKDKKYQVTKSIGDFEENEIISNIPLEEMFSRILGLIEYIPPVVPDDPDSIITQVIENRLPLLSGTADDLSGNYEEINFTKDNYSDAPESKDTGTSIFYQKLDDNGNAEEYGYQSYTPATGRGIKLHIAIPKGLIISKVMIWSSMNNSWVLYEQSFEEKGNIENNGIQYTLYECSENGKGSTLRIIIEEQ